MINNAMHVSLEGAALGAGAPISPEISLQLVNSIASKRCPNCLNNPKDMLFGCGHQTCDCGKQIELCPLCRKGIEIRIKLSN
ncbi:hypothetical protein OROHE_014693 [Orobanche hederae]